MKARRGIVAGGNWIVDKVKTIDTYPQQDALCTISDQSICNGGSPFNVLVDLARLGAGIPLTAIGLVGDDPEGRWIREQCAQHGIDASRLGVHPVAPTSYTDVMTVRHTGRRTFFHQRGANAFLGPEHFDFGSVDGKIFHLGYLLLLDSLDGPDAEFGTGAARVLHGAGQAGFKTSIDVVSEDSQRFSGVVLPALRHVDYCILNEFELERTTGVATRLEGRIDPEAVQKASAFLIGAGVREWVVVHYPEGATAMGKDGVFRTVASLPVPQSEIVGTVGAGDAFAAGLLLGLHEELPVETALRYGVACAAACLLGRGTSEGIMTLACCLELEARFLGEHSAT